MRLAPHQAAAFGSIYRDYDVEQNKLIDQKLAAFQDYGSDVANSEPRGLYSGACTSYNKRAVEVEFHAEEPFRTSEGVRNSCEKLCPLVTLQLFSCG
jgi:hypothetical protein